MLIALLRFKTGTRYNDIQSDSVNAVLSALLISIVSWLVFMNNSERMRIFLAQIAILLVLLLVYANMALSLSHDWITGEAKCYHSPEKVSLLS